MANTFTLTDPKGKKTMITAEQAQSYNQGQNTLAEGFSVSENAPAPAPTQLKNPVPATNLQPATPVQLPEQTAPEAQMQTADSLNANLQTARTTLEKTYATQKAEVDAKVTELEKQQAETLAKAKPLTEPFRQELETTQRKKLQIEDNFMANQKLTNELDALLQEQNAIYNRAKGIPMNQRAQAIRTGRALQDIQARAGVVEAVINARNNQISVAENMIDRSISAIVADRTDSLNYYNTILDLDNNKLLTLSAESKALAEKQVGLLESDLANAQATSDYIKGLMIDPNTATLLSDAGVTLTDSVEDINKKMSKQVKVREMTEFMNQLTEAGYDAYTIPMEGAEKYTIGGVDIYAKVRPGSEKDLALKKARADIQNTYALANSRVSGPGTQSTPYASDMDALIGNALQVIPTKFGQEQFQAQIAKARDDADRLNIVAAQVLKGAPAADKTDFKNQAVGISQLDKAIALLDEGVQTGALQAGAQYVYNLAGKDFDPKLAEINSLLVSAIQPYRNSVTGAAWGTQETQEYNQLFGSTKFSPEELKLRLETVKEALKSKSSTALNAYVNPLGYGENQFATGQFAPTLSENLSPEQTAALGTFDSVIGTTDTAQTTEDGSYLSNLWSAIWGN